MIFGVENRISSHKFLNAWNHFRVFRFSQKEFLEVPLGVCKMILSVSFCKALCIILHIIATRTLLTRNSDFDVIVFIIKSYRNFQIFFLIGTDCALLPLLQPCDVNFNYLF
jgi:hypothetical protein